MEKMTIPPDEVLIEAAKRANIGEEPIEYLRKIYPRAGSFRALCDMIQKYEKPPVDRKLLCAREAAAQLYSGEREEAEFMRGHRDEYDQVWCGKRAIELWEEGFGYE
jgi:hypothetical protein